MKNFFLRKNNRISFSGLVVVEEHLFDLIGVAFGEVVSGGGTEMNIIKLKLEIRFNEEFNWTFFWTFLTCS